MSDKNGFVTAYDYFKEEEKWRKQYFLSLVSKEDLKLIGEDQDGE